MFTKLQLSRTDVQMNGTITRLIHVRGYGFLIDEEGEERFINAENLEESHLWPTLRKGQRIEFEAVERPHGQRNRLGVARVRVK
jgi:cold shock CspA family protein